MGLNLSSTLDFIGYISRSLVSVIDKIFLDANKVSEFRAQLVSEVAALFAPKSEAYALAA